MPHDFIKSTRTFTTPDGRTLNRRDIRAKIEKLLDYVKRQATKLASRFDEGDVSASEFGQEMKLLLKDAHLISATVGRGGREQMDARNWGKLGSRIKAQNEYVDRFVKKLNAGTLSKAATANRARSYSAAVYMSYADTRLEADKEAAASNPPKEDEILVRLELNADESCSECEADAAMGWVKPDELEPLGNRLCGPFCRCEISFSDEEGMV